MNRMKSLPLIAGVTLVSALISPRNTLAQSVGTTAEGGMKAGVFYSAIAGEWVGSLEYRDYSNDKRVKLPTTLAARPSKDGKSVELRFRYDEGKGRFVDASETISIDPEAGKLVEQSLDHKDNDRSEYSVTSGLQELLKRGTGEIALAGTGEENDRKVDVKKTIAIGDKSLTILKETRLPEGSFLFRNRYTFQRKEANQP